MCQIVVTEHSDLLVVINSQAEIIDSDNIAGRLRAARNAMGLSQRDFAGLGGVTLNTQHRYEAGTFPPVEYLLRVGEAGADWYWIVTGRRIGDALSQEETAFLDAFRQMDDAGRAALLLVAQRMVSNTPQANSITPVSVALHDGQSDFKGAK